jgi:hypothetical protein
MANITEILGTDSLSSSRLTINSNFTALNDEIADITSLVDPVTSTITGIDSISAESINLSYLQGGSSSPILSIDSTGAVFSVATDFAEGVDVQNKLQKSGVVGAGGSGNGTTVGAPASIDVSTYFSGVALTLPVGAEGQEVTIISTASAPIAITAGTGVSLGATSISLDDLNSSVTVRFFSSNNTWYVISSHAATFA